MFFQLILCLAIWTVGLVVNCFRNFPKFCNLRCHIIIYYIYILHSLINLYVIKIHFHCWEALFGPLVTYFIFIFIFFNKISFDFKIGNINTVPIIQTIGIGIGILIWGLVLFTQIFYRAILKFSFYRKKTLK
jgi:hypothetical protein